MTARDYLKRYSRAELVIKNRMEQIEHLKDVAQGCTASIDGDRVQTSGVSRKMENVVVKYADLQRDLVWEIEEMQALKKEILQTIELLPAGEYEVIYLLYIKTMMLKQVEKEVKRSHSWVTMTHRKALDRLQKIIDERQKK